MQAKHQLFLGYDIIVRSETGSGKTASFLLPVIQNLYLEKRAKDAADLARKDKFTLDNAYQLMVPVNALIIGNSLFKSRYLIKGSFHATFQQDSMF